MISDFDYFAPKTVEEALGLLSKYKEEAKILAGGQSSLVVMRQGLLKPEYVIDIKGLKELEYIKNDPKEGLKIGALTLHRDIEKSPVIKENFPVLSEMENNLATTQTRNWGTIGGNICHGDPAGDPAPVFTVLNARVKLAKSGKERTISMEEFSKDYLEVDLEPGEMLIEIQVPPIAPHTGVAYEKIMVMKGDMGIVGAAVSITLKAGSNVCESARIALSNAGSTPMRAKAAEKILIGKAITDALLEKAGEAAAAEADPPTDTHGSAAYRREMVKVFVKRVGKKAFKRAGSR
jgi:carbon-monoxide dehydrogenase medium subunit